MLRFIFRRKYKGISGVEYESMETIDLDVPEIESRLRAGAQSESQYDIRELIGVEPLEPIES